MSEQNYVMDDQPDALERRRLALLESIYDPETFRMLDEIGVEPGWRCLEVGAGSGSVTRQLASTVGVHGHVVATDINARFLLDLEAANVEVRVHDILADPLETKTFDLAHCRLLLVHLKDPVLAVSRMAAALRPGGWLAIEDTDISLAEAADPAHPSADLFNRLNRLIVDSGRRAGTVDPYSARRVRDFLALAGLVDVRHTGSITILSGGEPGAVWLGQAMAVALERMGEHLVRSRDYTKADLEHFLTLFDDPGFSFVGLARFQAWGRRS